jgi:hypothetical protein
MGHKYPPSIAMGIWEKKIQQARSAVAQVKLQIQLPLKLLLTLAKITSSYC